MKVEDINMFDVVISIVLVVNNDYFGVFRVVDIDFNVIFVWIVI